jgi:hypothetical protein
MLAYIFWHWPQDEIGPEHYEQALIGFHERLATVDLEGFYGSATFRVEGASWVGPESRGYEDWYLLEGSSTLDLLNEVAASGDRKGPHDRVAHASSGGSGGLYRLRSGEPAAVGSSIATWLTKRRETGYEEFYSRLSPWTNGPGTSLWRRQMVLGSAPEFCVLGTEEQGFPADWEPITVKRFPIRAFARATTSSS